MERLMLFSKIFPLVLFFSFYCGVIVWAYAGKNRKKLEEHRQIPFLED